ncbi:hypothetical protein [Neobacillus terrae]|uniref:hypothetical protein n=1 Tax=Neobacillus terrae TaxID=3034837 RepID=UPI00140BB216|nr:hypothetical protein [Neobacillus terrae]NHM32769.1 hypothetical protein [Neobacillus terrae]
MIKALQNFVEELEKKKYLSDLYWNRSSAPVHFQVEDHNKSFSLMSCGDKIVIDNFSNNFSEGTVIYGSAESFKELFTGRATFRDLIKRGELKANASFRSMLRLESIFFLAVSQKDKNKD